MSFIEKCPWVESSNWVHVFFAIKGGVKLVTYQFIDCGSVSFNKNILTILSTVDRHNKNSALKLEVTPFNNGQLLGQK